MRNHKRQKHYWGCKLCNRRIEDIFVSINFALISSFWLYFTHFVNHFEVFRNHINAHINDIERAANDGDNDDDDDDDDDEDDDNDGGKEVAKGEGF